MVSGVDIISETSKMVDFWFVNIISKGFRRKLFKLTFEVDETQKYLLSVITQTDWYKHPQVNIVETRIYCVGWNFNNISLGII